MCDLLENKIEPLGDKNVEEKDSNWVQTQEFLDTFQKIDSCSYVDVNDTESWLEVNSDGGYGTITDKEIIASCSFKGTENSEETMWITNNQQSHRSSVTVRWTDGLFWAAGRDNTSRASHAEKDASSLQTDAAAEAYNLLQEIDFTVHVFVVCDSKGQLWSQFIRFNKVLLYTSPFFFFSSL